MNVLQIPAIANVTANSIFTQSHRCRCRCRRHRRRCQKIRQSQEQNLAMFSRVSIGTWYLHAINLDF